MLKTLDKYTQEERDHLLASVTDLFLPQPFPSEEAPTDEQKALVTEIRESLKIGQKDNSQQAQTRILQLLGQEMYAPIKNDKNRRDAAKKRLGAKGLLSDSQFKIHFSDLFKKEAPGRGIKQSFVKNVITNPDCRDHILPERIRSGDFPAISMYTKTYENAGDPFTFIVIAYRENDVLDIRGDVWRIFHSDVDVSSVTGPLELLRAFVNVYGLPVQAGNMTPKKFVYHEVFSVPEGPHQVIKIAESAGQNQGYVSFMYRLSLLHMYEISIAYAIDIARYRKDLHTHGVRTK